MQMKMKGTEEISEEDLLMEESIIECIQDNADCMYDDIVSEDDDNCLEMEAEACENEEGQIHEALANPSPSSDSEEGQIHETLVNPSQGSESEEEGQIHEALVNPSQGSESEEEGQIHEALTNPSQGSESEEEGQIDEAFGNPSQGSESEEEGQIHEAFGNPSQGSDIEEEGQIHEAFLNPSQHHLEKQSLVCDDDECKKRSVVGENDKIQKYKNVASVFIGNMPKGVDNDGLRKLFSRFGKILSARVLIDKHTGLGQGCGFVNFENTSDATMAIQHMHGYRLDGYQVKVRVAGPKPPPNPTSWFAEETSHASLYVCHLPATMDERRLADLFCPFGKIGRTRVMRDVATGMSKGYGFVDFEYIGDAEMARLVMNGYKIEGHRKLFVTTKRPPQPKPKPKEEMTPSLLYVKNLPQGMGEYQVRQLFSMFGNIARVNLVRDYTTGMSKGRARVLFQERDEMLLAVKNRNGYLVDGHVLTVTQAWPYHPNTCFTHCYN